jgi:regulator of sigma E protease
MQGEDGKSLESEQQRAFLAAGEDADAGSFQAKSPGARIAIAVAGPAANFIVAFVIMVVSALAFGVASDNAMPMIGPLMDGMPAQRAGLQTGDQVLAINGVPITNGLTLVAKIHSSLGHTLVLRYRRNGVVEEVAVKPVRSVQEGKVVGVIGFTPVPTFERVGPLAAIETAGRQYVSAIVVSVSGTAQFITHPVQNFSNVTGPIGMERAAASYQDFGWAAYLSFAAYISIALGIINLLPIPALDGGRAVFIIAELLRGRPVDPEKEALIHVAGFALLMTLMVFVAFHDISKVIAGKGVF